MKRGLTNYKTFSQRKNERKSQYRLILTVIVSIFLLYALAAWILPALIGGLSAILHAGSTHDTTIQTAASDTVLPPPVLNIPYEATNTAQIKIDGYSTANTQVEIYDNNALQTTVKTDENGGFSAPSINLDLGDNAIYGITLDNKGNKSLPSKGIDVSFDNQPPTLNISSPSDNQVITGGDKKVTVSGTTDPNSSIVLEVNGDRVIINQDGSFSDTVNLNDGDNTITISAQDNAGNVAQVSKKVTYKSG